MYISSSHAVIKNKYAFILVSNMRALLTIFNSQQKAYFCPFIACILHVLCLKIHLCIFLVTQLGDPGNSVVDTSIHMQQNCISLLV